MLDSFFNDMLSPLGPAYCDYFYYLMVIEFILISFIILRASFVLLTSSKKDSVSPLMYSLPGFILSYFTHRLLYSMCAASLK